MKKISVLMLLLAFCLSWQTGLKGQKWDGSRDVIPEYVGWDGNPASIKVLIDPSWNDAQKAKIRNGMKKWNDAGGKPSLVETGSPPAEIIVKKEPATSADEGSFTPTENLSNGKWMSGEITLKETPSTAGLDLEEVAAHEFGHALGLDDTDHVANPGDVMKGEGPSNGTLGGLSQHDTTEMEAAKEIAYIVEAPVRRAFSPEMAIFPGESANLVFSIPEVVPPESSVVVATIADPFLHVTSTFLEGNMLFVQVYSDPIHYSGTIYFNVMIMPPHGAMLNFIGTHYVSNHPVPLISFECPFFITETDGRVLVNWEESHTYPFSGPLRATLQVDNVTLYENRPIGNFNIELDPGIHVFALYVDDYQVNSASYTITYEVIGSGTGTAINPGADLWTIPCGELRLGAEGDYPALAEGFFGPGSDPFDGLISLKGQNSNGSQTPASDITINRLESAVFSGTYPVSAALPLEEVSWAMKSSSPIVVHYNNIESFFDVFVELNVDKPHGGMANIIMENPHGGTFTQQVSFTPIITFTEVGNPTNKFIFNPGNMGYPALSYSSASPYPWTLSPIAGEFDPIGSDKFVLQSLAGTTISLLPFLARNDNFMLAMNEQGYPEMMGGSGFNNGTWYNYPNFDWWNVWFYDHPVATDRQKVITGDMMIMPRNVQMPSYVEIVYNWSTPLWPGYPEIARPPMPGDVIDSAYEVTVIQRSDPLFIWQGNIYEPIPLPVPYEILNYNPEWLSIDLRGNNFVLQGNLQHVCWKPGDCEGNLDWGDAPDSTIIPVYPSLLANNGARHLIDGIIYLGNLIDAETDGQPSSNADGDDLNNLDDEDGITFVTPLIPGQTATVEITFSVADYPLNAWIDFNGDGDWNDLNEHIFTDLVMCNTVHYLSFNVPAGAVPGCTFARFRYSSEFGLQPTGYSASGEVEDYKVIIVNPGNSKMHWPQMPKSGGWDVELLPFTLADDFMCTQTGAISNIRFWISWMQNMVQPLIPITVSIYSDIPASQNPKGFSIPGTQLWTRTFSASQFDLQAMPDNEQGWFNLPPGTGYGFPDHNKWFQITMNNILNPFMQTEGTIYWLVIDLHQASAGWKESGSQHFNDAAVYHGSEGWLPLYDPYSGNPLDLSFIISNNSFEESLDYGDAPDMPYPTLLANSGARHKIIPTIYMGTRIDAEFNGQPNAAANGDDLAGVDDEDGVTMTKPFAAGNSTKIKVRASTNGFLNAWIDFNKNGSWSDIGEQVFINVPLVTGINNLIINVPAEAMPGETYSRFRFNTTGGLNYFGYASDGEVEDYKIIVHPLNWGYIPTNASHVVLAPVNLLFNCINLSAGDFIGAFYADESGGLACGGAAYWDGLSNQVVIAYGNDLTTTEKEGFDEEEFFTWKVYYNASGTEQIVEVDYDATLPNYDGKFHTNGLSAIASIGSPIEVTATATPTVICAGDVVQLNAEISGGCPPYTFTWTSDPEGFTSTLQNPTDTPDVTTTYFVTVNDGFNNATAQVTVTIIFVAVECPENITVCLNDEPFILTGATPEGGTYSGDGVSDGVFYPALAGVGIHVITYTYVKPGTNCYGTCTFNIIVNPLPQIYCPPFMQACEGDPKVLLNSAYPQGGEYSGYGVSFDGVSYWFDPGVGVSIYVITYCFTDPATTCTNCCEFNFYVFALPEVYCPGDLTICIDTPPFILTGATPSGGVYSGEGVSDGLFYPAIAGEGEHEIAYTYTNPQTLCTNFCVFKIFVIEVIVECPEDLAVCVDDDPFELTGATPEGGFYTGDGVFDGYFYPGSAGVGTHTITYTYVVPGTNCWGTCTFVIFVKPLPQIDCPQYMDACENDPKVLLNSAYPQGGEYSGYGVSFDGVSYWFDPSVGTGVYVIMYCFTDPATICTNCCEFPMYVHPMPDVTCPEDFSVCINTDPFILSGGNPIPGTYSGFGVINNTFYPNLAGVGSFTITYCYFEPQFNCKNCCTFVITVFPAIVVECPDDFAVCLNDEPFLLTGASPEGGTYSGPGVINGFFDPALAGVGFHTITYTYIVSGTNCIGTCEFVIHVKPLPQIVCPADFEVCLNSPTLLLNIASPQGGEYSGAGVIYENGFYYFDPSIGAGEYIITYCFTDLATNCTNCCEFVISIVANQLIEIPDGWSGISSYIIPDNPAMSSVLYPITYPFIILSNFSGVYWPDGGVYTITSWDEYSGYSIKMNYDATLPICGDEVSNKIVNLNQGWNLIPVLSSWDVDIVSLFSGVPGFQIAKDVAANGIYWPAYNINTIGNVLSGKAYYVRMTAPGSIDYSVPGIYSFTKKQINLMPPKTPWNQVTNVPGSHLVAFNVLDNSFAVGDIVGGFTSDGLCAGVVEITDKTMPFAVSLNGDDLTSPETDGFEAGEIISYKLFRPGTSEIFDLEVSYKPETNTGYFENNGLSEITKVKMSATGIANSALFNLKIYPNPSQGIFTITGISKPANIIILNAFGEEIYQKEMTLPARLDFTNRPKGVYLIKVEIDNTVLFEKLVIN